MTSAGCRKHPATRSISDGTAEQSRKAQQSPSVMELTKSLPPGWESAASQRSDMGTPWGTPRLGTHQS